jgi:hypothetical protein
MNVRVSHPSSLRLSRYFRFNPSMATDVSQQN